MTRSLHSIKKSDIIKAYKAVIDAGGEVCRVEIDKDGRIIIVIGKPGEPSTESAELDAWMAKHAS
jgi:hypothetical protein